MMTTGGVVGKVDDDGGAWTVYGLYEEVELESGFRHVVR